VRIPVHAAVATALKDALIAEYQASVGRWQLVQAAALATMGVTIASTVDKGVHATSVALVGALFVIALSAEGMLRYSQRKFESDLKSLLRYIERTMGERQE
jgi:hypothetical protein